MVTDWSAVIAACWERGPSLEGRSPFWRISKRWWWRVPGSQRMDRLEDESAVHGRQEASRRGRDGVSVGMGEEG